MNLRATNTPGAGHAPLIAALVTAAPMLNFAIGEEEAGDVPL